MPPECLRGELQCHSATGVSEQGAVSWCAGSAGEDGIVAAKVQCKAATQLVGIPDTGRVPRRGPDSAAGARTSPNPPPEPRDRKRDRVISVAASTERHMSLALYNKKEDFVREELQLAESMPPIFTN